MLVAMRMLGPAMSSQGGGVSQGMVAVPAERLHSLCSVALRRALAGDLTTPATIQGVRPLLFDACREAHARGMRAEQLLVALKAAWFELPEAHGIPRHAHAEMLARVVTLCIDEYYRSSA